MADSCYLCTVESTAAEICRAAMCSPFLPGDIQWCSLFYTAIGFNRSCRTGVSFEISTTFSNFVEIANSFKIIISGKLIAKCRQKGFSHKPVSLGDQAKKDVVKLRRVRRRATGRIEDLINVSQSERV